MLPFHKKPDVQRRDKVANWNHGDTSFTSIQSNISNSERRNYNFNRSMVCQPNQPPIAGIGMPSSMCEIPSVNQSGITSIYQLQPHTSSITQWPNQQMTFGVMSVPVVQAVTAENVHQNKVDPLINKNTDSFAFKQQNANVRMLPNSTISQTKNKLFVVPSTEVTDEQKSSRKNEMENSYHLVGSVEQVIRWYQIAKSANISAVYEVHGTLESIQMKGKDIVNLVIRQGHQGLCIQGVFCAIDRPFMDFLKSGDNIVCSGLMKGARKLQVLNAWRETEKLEDYKRISFLCQMALQQNVLKES